LSEILSTRKQPQETTSPERQWRDYFHARQAISGWRNKRIKKILLPRREFSEEPPLPAILAFIVIPAKAGIQARPTRLAQQDDENTGARPPRLPLRSSKDWADMGIRPDAIFQFDTTILWGGL
jgi:hypothetical protein